MTEKASADDFEVQDFLKKKKKKKKRKHKEYDKNQENEEGESTQNAELDCAPPLLLEDQAAQSGEGFKKKKKKKRMREEQQSLLDSSCVELEHEFSNETAEEAPRKKKKKKKHKHNDSVDDQSVVTCDTVDQYTTDNCQKIDADYVYLEESVKKKKKKKLREKNEVQELPISQTETHDENEGERSEKKRKKKKKKKRGSSIQDVQEDTGDQLLLSSPEPNRQREDTALPLPTEEGDVTPPQELHKDDDCDASACENSVDVPANFSSPTKPANQSQNAPRARKAVKSRALILEESSSESDVETPEPSGSNRKDKNSSFTEASDAPNADEEDCLDSATCSATDLDTIKQELEEFIPHVRDISDSSIRKIAGRDLVRFREFKKQGIAVKFGRFSQKENNQIRKNIEAFLATTGIDSAEKLLFTSRYPEDKGTISRLKAEHLFCEKISEGIPRPWRLIYYRARKMFDPNNYKGRYSVEEKEKLKKYHALHGNDWKKISEMMSRSNLSVAMKYSEIKSDVNYGPWSKEETQKLMHAVEEVIRKRMKMEDANSLPSSDKSDRDVLIDCEKLSQKLPWTEIEAKVGTRYWRQCKQKWLYEMKVEDANEVNWEELSDTVGPVPGAYIRAKFYKLKVSCVPFWQKKSFSEIVDYLYEKKLPELEKQLEKRKGSRVRSDNSAASQAKKALRFCDIFDCSEDSD
uniref:Transcription termination factor 1 n=1 Tax=Hypotaenidia okinawae TaxID=2861861 RepID=A0A6G1RI72_9GRUI